MTKLRFEEIVPCLSSLLKLERQAIKQVQASALEPNNLNFKIMNCTQYPNSR